MVPRGFLGARGLLRAHGGSSRKGNRLFSSTEPGVENTAVEAKLEEYCAKVPAPLSIAEFTERGRYRFSFMYNFFLTIRKAGYDERGSEL